MQRYRRIAIELIPIGLSYRIWLQLVSYATSCRSVAVIGSWNFTHQIALADETIDKSIVDNHWLAESLKDWLKAHEGCHSSFPRFDGLSHSPTSQYLTSSYRFLQYLQQRTVYWNTSFFTITIFKKRCRAGQTFSHRPSCWFINDRSFYRLIWSV